MIRKIKSISEEGQDLIEDVVLVILGIFALDQIYKVVVELVFKVIAMIGDRL